MIFVWNVTYVEIISIQMMIGVIYVPRCARVKSSDSIYHIMCRSISDVKLFRKDSDKDKYLFLISKYQTKHEFKVYAYCIMDTHVHLIIDSNGADISKIMHGINQCYSQYFNLKYKRHGHVFQDRFKSKIIMDDNYLITASAYIHNNPSDLSRYKKHVENYKYSTLGIYLGLRRDEAGIVDEDFIMGLFSLDGQEARESYLKMVRACTDNKMAMDVEFKFEKSQYRSERVILNRNYTPEQIRDYVSKVTNIDSNMMFMKRIRKVTQGKALCIFLMRCMCDFSYKEICSVIGDITLSRVAELCNMGLVIIEKQDNYKDIVKNFIASVKTA